MPVKGAKEKHVKAKIKKLLDAHNWFWWSPPANAYGRSGISDIHAVKTGMFMVVEAKCNGNTPTEMQKAFLRSVQTEGHFAFVVNEDTVTWLEQFLQALDDASILTQKRQSVSPELGSLMLNAMRVMTEAYHVGAAATALPASIAQS